MRTRSQELHELAGDRRNPLAVIETLARRNAFPVAPAADAGFFQISRHIGSGGCLRRGGWGGRGHYPLDVLLRLALGPVTWVAD